MQQQKKNRNFQQRKPGIRQKPGIRHIPKQRKPGIRQVCQVCHIGCSQKGILIIEIIIAISIVALIALAFTGATALYIRINNLEKNRTTAVNLAQEAMEAVKNFRDGTDWENNGIGGLSLGTNYYPKKSTDTPPKWQLISGEETIGAFKRKIVFSSVYRSSGSDDISSDDIGILAPDTRKVTVTVTWDQGAKKVEISSYITNWR